MSAGTRSAGRTAASLGLAVALLASCAPAEEQAGQPMGGGERWSYHDWPTGPYRVVADWPKPLPDTRHSHEGWTWGSFGGVYAETPDRVWIAMRGELPLQPGMQPWQAYGAVPGGQNAQPNSDGISATCQPANTRGWERRFEHSIFIVNREGTLVDEWPHLDAMFGAQRCGRGPHQIKMSPYDRSAFRSTSIPSVASSRSSAGKPRRNATRPPTPSRSRKATSTPVRS
jgi:hypothetical protein